MHINEGRIENRTSKKELSPEEFITMFPCAPYLEVLKK
jgi:hypothetical protein